MVSSQRLPIGIQKDEGIVYSVLFALRLGGTSVYKWKYI